MVLGWCLHSHTCWALISATTTTQIDHRPTNKPLVLLDRDGVINEDVGSPGVVCASQLLLTPNAGYAIGRLKRHGCSVVMITNQSSVGKGLLSHDDLDQIQQRVQELLWEQDELATLDRIYQCTSDDPCHPRRKPNPGMVLEAIKDFSCAPSTSYFVGDTFTDLQAAAAGGVDHRILVSTGYGQQLMRNRDSGVVPTEPLWIQNFEYNDIHPSSVPFLYCRNLAQAIDFILEHLERMTKECGPKL